MMWRVVLCLIAVVTSISAAGQGKIMLVGGGGETEGGWSNTPYQWAVDHSENKKVAVISYSTEDNWIPDYFKSLGAVEADNIKIDSRTLADQQATYDLLMQYDAFFFKGGDQSYYYNYFKSTKTEQAIVDKFNAGGVMSGTSAGMAILSGVIFTAQNGSVYPDDALNNINDSDITLADDFLPFLPGIIVDTHFTERGRGVRLLAFMANWFIHHSERLTGIGVDDRTALCIDENNLATVYGTGAVSIYQAESFSVYQSNKMVSDNVQASQLLHGHTINLNTFEITNGPVTPVAPNPIEESGNYEIILSGGEGYAGNVAMLDYFVSEAGEVSDSVLVVTAPGKATPYKERLDVLGAPYALLEVSASANDEDQIELRNAIRTSKKVLFVENDDSPFISFLQGGQTGTLLGSHIRRNKMIIAFVGEDSRYAGKTFVSNHLTDAYAAYYGRLNFKDGLALLPTSTIMSNTYDANTTDYYENTTAAVPYAMVTAKLRFGIYLNRNGYATFRQEGGLNTWKSVGPFSTLIIENTGTTTDVASQPVSGNNSRDYVGYMNMNYYLLNGESTLLAGHPIPSTDQPYVFEERIVGIENESQTSAEVFPNPSTSGLFTLMTNDLGSSTFVILNGRGEIIYSKSSLDESVKILNLSTHPNGLYYLVVTTGETKKVIKIIK
jgi:cyanophycinase